MNQYLFDRGLDALWSADDLDAMIDAALESFPGGRGGRVRTDISPWPGLLNRTVQALQRAIGFLAPPITPRSLNNALYQIDGAEALLNADFRGQKMTHTFPHTLAWVMGTQR